MEIQVPVRAPVPGAAAHSFHLLLLALYPTISICDEILVPSPGQH